MPAKVTHEISPREKHIYKMHAYEIHAYEMHAYKMHAPALPTPRVTPRQRSLKFRG
jgi:hypothetical protein